MPSVEHPAESHPRPPAPTRRGRPGYDAATVLRRAIALFNQQGYDATSMGDLALDLGLSKSAIYHHVTSKESLLATALDEALAGLETAFEHGSDSPAPAAERLRTVLHRSIEVLAAHLPAVTLLLRVRGNSPIEVAALERRRLLDERLAALVAAAIAEGSLRPDLDPELSSRLLFGTVNSLIEWYRPEGTLPPGALADAVVALLFGGLGSRADQEPQASKSTLSSAEIG